MSHLSPSSYRVTELGCGSRTPVTLPGVSDPDLVVTESYDSGDKDIQEIGSIMSNILNPVSFN